MEKKKKRLMIKKTLMSGIKFKKKTALSFHKMEYYQTMQRNLSNLELRELEKKRYKTTMRARTAALIKLYKKKGEREVNKTASIIKGIYDLNYKTAINKELPPRTNSNLHSILCKPNFLMLAYRSIKGNKGSLTKAYVTSFVRKKRMTPEQRSFVERTFNAPDGINFEIFEITAELLKEGKYPWGTSRRIHIDKPAAEQPSFGPAPLPGTDKKRPITIPPFMDKVVQTEIKMVLESVYEPYFEYQNQSFGFRTHKGCHDAIYNLSRPYTTTMNMSIEGDFKSAYDLVKKIKLLEILGLRIKDKKFLALIKERLDYEVYDTEKGAYLNEKEGIPQGGIDSPYLWNIYMHHFDTWVNEYLTQYFEKINNKTRFKKYSPTVQLLFNERTKTKYALKKGNTNKEKTYDLINRLRLINHKKRSQPTIDPNKRPCKFVYCRYADDWIILFTGNLLHAKVIKEKIKNWLETELHATLSVEKTLITDMKKEHSKFLGFELFNQKHQKISWVLRTIPLEGNKTGKKWVLTKVTNARITVGLDKQRLINRFHMKGYCDKKGFPISIPWLSHLEPHIILERFNSVIRGLSNYYAGMISNLSEMRRWIYILRYSCLKTLCNKYKTSISKLFKRFRSKNGSMGKTIEVKVTINFNSETYYKKWRLITYKEAMKASLKLNSYERAEKTFNFFHYNKDPNKQWNYNPSIFPSIKDENYLDFGLCCEALRSAA